MRASVRDQGLLWKLPVEISAGVRMDVVPDAPTSHPKHHGGNPQPRGLACKRSWVAIALRKGKNYTRKNKKVSLFLTTVFCEFLSRVLQHTHRTLF